MAYTFTDEDRQRTVDLKQEEALRDIQSDSPQYRSNLYLKKMIKQHKLLPYCCSGCGISKWKDQDLVLELDHIDGDAANNKLSNLRLLCPNCHSLTSTYRGRSINTGKKKVSDEELIVSLRESPNIRQALINVGLSPRGGNYSRATRLKTQVLPEQYKVTNSSNVL
jgi:5-methylcytosine-specific restriction endonuclease McrA